MPKGDAKEGYLNTNAHLEAEVALLMAQLAESQARELRLREALDGVDAFSSQAEMYCVTQKALATPQDDSVLREMIEAAKAEERSPCAAIADDSDHIVDGRGCYDQLGDAKMTASNIADAIRARKG